MRLGSLNGSARCCWASKTALDSLPGAATVFRRAPASVSDDAEAWLRFITRNVRYVRNRGMICCATISICAISYL
jgi:hypothetical protein